MLVGQTQTFPEGVHYDEYRIGGTSLSSPLFAGVVALSDDLFGYHHGFINPRLYATLERHPGHHRRPARRSAPRCASTSSTGSTPPTAR